MYTWVKEPKGLGHVRTVQHNTWDSLISLPSWWPQACHFLSLGLSFLILNKGQQYTFSAPFLWRRQWHPTPILLPGKSHGWRSLVGCSPWGHEELDTTERLHFHFHALEKEMATHSSVLAWRIPGTGEPGGLPSMGSHRVGHDCSDLAAAAPFLCFSLSGLSVLLFRTTRSLV